MPYGIETPQLPQAPKKRLPHPAQGNPSLERAVTGLEAVYPKDMQGVTVQPDWSNEMYTNTAGYVDPKHPTDIKVNALNAATSDQGSVDWIARHELEHVKQMRNPWQRASMAVQNILPYSSRPYEHQAETAADDFMKNERLPSPRDEMMPTVGGRFMYDMGKSPAVNALVDLLKK